MIESKRAKEIERERKRSKESERERERERERGREKQTKKARESERQQEGEVPSMAPTRPHSVAVGIWALRAVKGNSDGAGNSDVAGT